MPIQSGDVKLLKSAIMSDAPESGGAPTGNEIADGVSNAIFPDISELDRAGGRVNLRKTFVGVQTTDTDTYFGANVIVAEPPQDPRVSVTLFSTENTFDTRTQAQTRIESYLNKGPEWPGYLFENHIAGQRVIQLFQRVSDPLPNVGQTLVLIENEGLGAQKEQYVRVTAVSAVERTFSYSNGSQIVDYQAMVVTCGISDALRFDFTGSPASRFFFRTSDGATAAPNRTKLRDTVVADAGTYVGVVPLTETASIGDFTVKGESIFTQLVPAAQTETPISDVRTNGLSAALVPTGSPITQTLTLGFTTTQNMFVGGPIYPGSLSVVRSGVTVTDDGGVLMSSGAQVGTVDYENGILSLSTNVFGTSSGSHTVTFTPAEVPELISKQAQIRVTTESRSLSYAYTLDTPPVRLSLSVAYLAQGRWYVLRDNGTGVVRGNDAAFGAGTINYTTGSLVLTLGALPDVGSSVIITYYADPNTEPASNTNLLNNGRFYFTINTSGHNSEEPGSKAIQPGSLVIGWTYSGTKTATDNGLGVITGDATGTVDYSNGIVRLSPNLLPPPGTVFVVDINGTLVSKTTGLGYPSGNLGATNITPGSVQLSVPMKILYTWLTIQGFLPGTANKQVTVTVYDRGGVLYMQDPGGNNTEIACGTINYSTGEYTITSPGLVGDYDINGPVLSYEITYASTPGSAASTTGTLAVISHRSSAGSIAR